MLKIKKLQEVLFLFVLISIFFILSTARAEVIFSEDFELGQCNWWADNGVWEIGTPTAGPEFCYDGNQCAGTVLGGNYPNITDSHLVSPSILLPPVNVAECEEIHLRFWHWFSYYNLNDGGYVGISVQDEGTGTWSDWAYVSNAFTPTSAVWSQADVDLTEYAGKKVRIAFYHVADGGGQNCGWYIDAIEVVVKVPEFTGNFESGWRDWSADNGVWEIGTPTAGPEFCYDGNQCAGTVLGGNYPNITDSHLVSPSILLPPVNVAGCEEIHLRFWHWFSYYNLNDGGYVGISVQDEGTGTWSDWAYVSNAFTPTSAVWSQADVDLTEYAGKKVRIAFYHVADGGGQSYGWYIDAIDIIPKNCYRDYDSDGYGDPNQRETLSSCLDGYVENNTDCNDDDPNINPGASELCDDIDNDCDGSTDEDFDLQNDPNNCGECGYKCPEGFFCLNSECFPWITQEIPLCQGWNLISFQINKGYYEGTNPTEGENPVFIPQGVILQDVGSLADWLSNDANSPLRDKANPCEAGNWQRITSFDSNGGHIMDKDLPSFINTLKYISAGYGYWIKMNEPGTLVLEGQFLSVSTPLELQNGWNLIGYIPDDTCYADIVQNDICPYNSGVYPPGEGIVYCPIDPFTPSVFTSIEGKYRRITSFDCCGGGMIYDTQLPAAINTLHYIGPKYGYWIKIEDTEGAELIFPENCSGIY